MLPYRLSLKKKLGSGYQFELFYQYYEPCPKKSAAMKSPITCFYSQQ